jgi:hypothetical protein
VEVGSPGGGPFSRAHVSGVDGADSLGLGSAALRRGSKLHLFWLTCNVLNSLTVGVKLMVVQKWAGGANGVRIQAICKSWGGQWGRSVADIDVPVLTLGIDA